MATLEFDLVTKLATVQAPATVITCQETYDQFRDFEDKPQVMSNKDLVLAAGKDALAGGAQTIITVRMLDGWRLKFADRAGPGITECVVAGGNLVASDEAGVDQLPIEPSTFVFVSFANATTGALIDVVEIARLRKWMTNRQELTEAASANFVLYDDDDIAVSETQTVTDKDGNPIILPTGVPAKRSQAT